MVKVRNVGDVQTVELYGEEYLTTESMGKCSVVFDARHNDGFCCLSKEEQDKCVYRNSDTCMRLRMRKQYDTLLDKVKRLMRVK